VYRHNVKLIFIVHYFHLLFEKYVKLVPPPPNVMLPGFGYDILCITHLKASFGKHLQLPVTEVISIDDIKLLTIRLHLKKLKS